MQFNVIPIKYVNKIENHLYNGCNIKSLYYIKHNIDNSIHF